MRIKIPDRARNMGIHVVAAKGSGKSRLIGRGILFQDFRDGIPTVVLDPKGQTIDNFLDRLMWLDLKEQQELTKRIVYVDMSGRSGYVHAFPLYYRLPGDSLRKVATRFLELVVQ